MREETDKYIKKINTITKNTNENAIHYIDENKISHITINKGKNIEQITIVIVERKRNNHETTKTN